MTRFLLRCDIDCKKLFSDHCKKMDFNEFVANCFKFIAYSSINEYEKQYTSSGSKGIY